MALKKYITRSITKESDTFLKKYRIVTYDGKFSEMIIMGQNVKHAICMYILEHWHEDRLYPFHKLAGKRMDPEATMDVVWMDLEISEETVIKIFESNYNGVFCLFLGI